MAPDQARSTTARLHPRPRAMPARKRPPSPDGSTPQDRAQWQRLVARQAEQGAGPADCRSRTGGAAATRVAGLLGGAGAGAVHRASAPAPPRSASLRKLRADGPANGSRSPCERRRPFVHPQRRQYSLGHVINTQHPFSDIQLSHTCEILWVACAQHGCGLVVRHLDFLERPGPLQLSQAQDLIAFFSPNRIFQPAEPITHLHACGSEAKPR